jgi:hypothetical protein
VKDVYFENVCAIHALEHWPWPSCLLAMIEAQPRVNLLYKPLRDAHEMDDGMRARQLILASGSGKCSWMYSQNQFRAESVPPDCIDYLLL